MQIIATATAAKKIYMGILAVFTWFAIVLQWYLTTGSITNFFSYFTILCNTSIALCLTFSLFNPSSVPGRFFSSVSVQSAIALYISIVGLVYNLVLRGLLAMEGWQLFVDNVLHVVIPVLYMVYWFMFVPGRVLQWKDGLSWIFFPLIYLVYSLIRGAIVNWYPYPFSNAANWLRKSFPEYSDDDYCFFDCRFNHYCYQPLT